MKMKNLMLCIRFQTCLEVQFLCLKSVKIMKSVRWKNQLVKVERSVLWCYADAFNSREWKELAEDQKDAAFEKNHMCLFLKSFD